MEQFKRGDKVIYIMLGNTRLTITQAEVTAVRTQLNLNHGSSEKDETLVYVKSVAETGYEWKQTFSSQAVNMYGYGDRHPLWMLRHLNEDEMENLKKIAEKTSRLYEEYQQRCEQIHRDVEEEARKWRFAEQDRRIAEIPHGSDWVRKQITKMGFKQPGEKVTK